MEEINNRVEVLKRSTIHKEGQRVCRAIYSDTFGDSDLRVFHELGTGGGAGYILSHVEGDLGARWEVFSKKWPITRWWYRIAKHQTSSRVIGFVKMEAASTFYLYDIVKDVRLIWILATKIPSEAAILYGTSIVSLTVSELIKGPSIYNIRKFFGFFDPLPSPLSAFGTDLQYRIHTTSSTTSTSIMSVGF